LGNGMKAIFNRIRAAIDVCVVASEQGGPAPDAGYLKGRSGFNRTQSSFKEAGSTKYRTKGDTS